VQPRLDWDRECPLPVAPSASPQARHASATGAQVAAVTRWLLTLRYIELLERLGPRSDHEASRALGVGLSSINSTRAALGAQVTDDAGNYEVHVWPSGRMTRRTRWRLVPPAAKGDHSS
jgi:hypothetical protein